MAHSDVQDYGPTEARQPLGQSRFDGLASREVKSVGRVTWVQVLDENTEGHEIKVRAQADKTAGHSSKSGNQRKCKDRTPA
jgi:hypothetical protein